jgi:hypothetical protein
MLVDEQLACGVEADLVEDVTEDKDSADSFT